MIQLLGKINYNKFELCNSGDLKVGAILSGSQFGYTKYCCFVCECVSRARKYHYFVKHWLPRESSIPGNGKYFNQIFLPSLHIKWSVMENWNGKSHEQKKTVPISRKIVGFFPIYVQRTEPKSTTKFGTTARLIATAYGNAFPPSVQSLEYSKLLFRKTLN